MTSEAIDLTTLNYQELLNLAGRANNLATQKRFEDKKKAKEELLASDRIKKLRAKLKELEKEYQKLPKKDAVTMQVPLKFTLSIKKDDDFFNVVSNCTRFYGNTIEGIFLYILDGSVQAKNNNLTKEQKYYINQQLEYAVQDACEESVRIFPDTRKKLDDFIEKLEKTTKEVNELIYNNLLTIDDLK